MAYGRPCRFGADAVWLSTLFGTYYFNDMNPFTLVRGTADAGEQISMQHPLTKPRLTPLRRSGGRFISGNGRETAFFISPIISPMYRFMPRRLKKALRCRSLRRCSARFGRCGRANCGGAQKRRRLDNTLILITSDNGPWWEGRGVRRGRKGSVLRAAFACLYRHWPQQIKPSRSDALAMGTDLLPTM